MPPWGSGEGEDVGMGGVEMLCDGGKLVGQRVENSVELGVHRLGVGLVIDRVQQCFDPAPADLGVVVIRFAA